jgi:hypothetical protein
MWEADKDSLFTTYRESVSDEVVSQLLIYLCCPRLLRSTFCSILLQDKNEESQLVLYPKKIINSSLTYRLEGLQCQVIEGYPNGASPVILALAV